MSLRIRRLLSVTTASLLAFSVAAVPLAVPAAAQEGLPVTLKLQLHSAAKDSPRALAQQLASLQQGYPALSSDLAAYARLLQAQPTAPVLMPVLVGSAASAPPPAMVLVPVQTAPATIQPDPALPPVAVPPPVATEVVPVRVGQPLPPPGSIVLVEDGEVLPSTAPPVAIPSETAEAIEDTAGDILIGAAAVGLVGGGIALAVGGSGGKKNETDYNRADDSDDGFVFGNPADFETPEYYGSNGLDAINASSAYAWGVSGAGVTVGVIDSGIDVNHPELAGRISSLSRAFTNGETAADDLTDLEGHGTYVAGIIAAARDGTVMHGVAPDATIVALKTFTVGDIPAEDTRFADAINYAIDNDIRLVNGSYTGINPEAAEALVRAPANDTLFVYAAGNDATPDPGFPALLPADPYAQGFGLASNLLAVVATSPVTGQIADYSARCGVAAAWCLAAPGGNATDFSGDLPPADSIISASPGDLYAAATGTSGAAPHVTGGAALLMQRFPGLSMAEIATRLLTTADKTGIYADQAVYGQGMLDLAAASQPIGSLSVRTGGTVSAATGFDLDSSRATLGPVFGDAVQMALADRSLTVFDSQNAPFQIDAASLVSAPSARLTADDMLDDLGRYERMRERSLAPGYGYAYSLSDTNELRLTRAPEDRRDGPELERFRFVDSSFDAARLELGFNDKLGDRLGLRAEGALDAAAVASESAFGVPYFAFSEDGYSALAGMELGASTLRVATVTGDDGDVDDAAVAISAAELTRPFGRASLASFNVGAMQEQGSVLGSATAGAFGDDAQADTVFAGLAMKLAMSETVAVVGSANIGYTSAALGAGSLIEDLQGIRTDSFSLGVTADRLVRADDRAGLLVNQPLRVSGGSASLAMPVGRTVEGGLLTQRTALSLAPSGREIDLEAFYSFLLADESSLTTSVMLRQEPGHLAEAEDEGLMLMRLRHKF